MTQLNHHSGHISIQCEKWSSEPTSEWEDRSDFIEANKHDLKVESSGVTDKDHKHAVVTPRLLQGKQAQQGEHP